MLKLPLCQNTRLVFCAVLKLHNCRVIRQHFLQRKDGEYCRWAESRDIVVRLRQGGSPSCWCFQNNYKTVLSKMNALLLVYGLALRLHLVESKTKIECSGSLPFLLLFI
jgi:hypothetical protein